MSEALPRVSFYAFGAVLLVSLLAGVYTENPFWVLPPLGLVLTAVGILNIRFLFYSLLFFLPLNVELELPGGFGTDFPGEFITVGLMFLTFAYLIAPREGALQPLYKSPLFLLIVLHYGWIIFSMLTSSLFLVSLKFTLAKTWYLVTFVILTTLVIRTLDDFKKAFWVVTIPLLLTVMYTLVRHAAEGFTFTSVNLTMAPFYRNHVNYAAMISEWLPFMLLAVGWYARKSLPRSFLLFATLVLSTGLIFSYTRSGWLAVIAAVGVVLFTRLKVMRYAFVLMFIGVGVGLFYVTQQYRFMKFAPEFEHTIYHQKLGEHLTSTYTMEDVSSAERVYRWVAGFKMWDANPLVGYGPGNFYNFYKGYTVTAFKTYVSDNPEKSTVHNYFILLLVEQGLIGLIIFVVLTVAIFIYGERLYHRVTDKNDKRWVLAILASLAAIYVNNSLSDMIETDKVGSIYFINIAMLIVLMHKYPSVKTRGEISDVVKV